MTPDEIEQMQKDIEAGTRGPWRASKVNPSRVFDPDNQPVMDRDPSFRVAPRYEANARRIARVPELEVEVLRLREALIHINAMDPEHRIDSFSENVVRGIVLHMGQTARAALNGRTDD